MKRLYNILFVLGIPALFLIFSSGTLYSGGSPGGKTGSPGDGSNCTSCHSGTAINEEFWISSPILQSTGYEEGQEYQIMVIGHNANASRFGFEATAEDGSNNKVGTISPGAMGWTQLTNSGGAITHTLAGSFPIVDTTALWTFSWIAPSTSVGEITFYAAVNTANGNGGNSGDIIHLSSFSASPSVGVAENTLDIEYSIYPNPTTGLLNINISEIPDANKIEILNMNGKLVHETVLIDKETKLDLSSLQKGMYLLRLGTDTKRFVIH